MGLQRQASAVVKANRILLYSPYEGRFIARGIPGGFWNDEERAWSYPARSQIANVLLAKFGDLTYTDEFSLLLGDSPQRQAHAFSAVPATASEADATPAEEIEIHNIRNHHAYLGGLLEHILSMANVAALIADHYQVDRSLLITGCILHDIGKINELSWDTAISYTDRGTVVGHIIMGIELVNKYAPANFPPRLLDMVKHLIISHHGRLEWASPKVPMTPEAILLHFLDDLDSKMAATSAAIDAPERQGVFTPYLAHMGRQICDVEEYLNG